MNLPLPIVVIALRPQPKRAGRTRFRGRHAYNSILVRPTVTTKAGIVIGPSASADTVPDHLPGVHDFVELLLIDIAGLERGLL